MKKISLRIILISIVIGIWAFVGIQLKKVSSPNSKSTTDSIHSTNKTNEVNILIGKKLTLNYIDPFNMSERNEKINQQANRKNNNRDVPPIYVNNKKPEVKNLKEKSIKWPKIIIKGVITKSSGENKYASIILNNENKIIQEGDVLEKDFFVGRITKDSLFLFSNLQKKSYAIN